MPIDILDGPDRYTHDRHHRDSKFLPLIDVTGTALRLQLIRETPLYGQQLYSLSSQTVSWCGWSACSSSCNTAQPVRGHSNWRVLSLVDS